MLNRICKSLLFTAMMTGVAYSFAQQLPAVTYKNPTLPVETRVADLLSRMTLEEKVGQLPGRTLNNLYILLFSIFFQSQ